ncbi:hypothetical protein BCR37DRAFT_377412 [Protomyces lactucae-debilis]|uniref:Uncharacterized protein n=1 Tax=Protomyces lactucae-debilis TaxID=2754530 RepID=A0A1Y2FNW7_PROLT|nr:uncharacterized protein BCR37DRAFT_377412 [Protomyces lactucae-debilis]ORY85702.1 hypothetical protein BCR37DRAFT_377412 [Protomyces lactucae-debilis]
MDAPSPAKLIGIIKQSLDGDHTQLSPAQAIALLCHANVLVAGFKCIKPVDGDTAPSSLDNVQPVEIPEDDIKLSYELEDTALDLKVSAMRSKIVIYGMDHSDNTASLEVATDEYTKSATNAESLVDSFISLAQVKAFSSLFKAQILNKLVANTDQSEEDDQSGKAAQTQAQPRAQAQEQREERIPMPSREEPLQLPNQGRQQSRPSDWPPELEDEHQLLQPARGQSTTGGRGIGRIGDDDLRPPGIDAMNPFGRDGPRMPGMGGGHRGMHPTPDDFFPGGGNTGPFGELPDGRTPGPAPPAGARYDPVFPGDPFGGPGRGMGRGRGGGGPGRGAFGGSDNMFG